MCEKLVREKIRKQFGGNLQAFVSGGGALDQNIGEFLNSVGHQFRVVLFPLVDYLGD